MSNISVSIEGRALVTLDEASQIALIAEPSGDPAAQIKISLSVGGNVMLQKNITAMELSKISNSLQRLASVVATI